MKIIVAVDQNPYSSRAVSEVAKLAANTWANVSLIGVQPKNALGKNQSVSQIDPASAIGPVPQALFTLRKRFLSHFDQKNCPYRFIESEEQLTAVTGGTYEVSTLNGDSKKRLNLRLRTGVAGKEILAEAREKESDLIVLGCDQSKSCSWDGAAGLPRKVATDAPCSVLIVKKKNNVKRIMCCLDQDRVSQSSLEMINQMVTLHDAQLTIVGLAESLSLKADVEKNMNKILHYYQDHQINPWIELVEIKALDAFIAQASKWGLIALWMGKQSILEKALPRNKVNKLIKGGDASVLILR